MIVDSNITGRRTRGLGLALVALAVWTRGASNGLSADEPAPPPAPPPALSPAESPAGAPSYEAVAEVLRQHCAACHAGSEAEGGLLLDSYQAMLRGGKRGAALVPGQSQQSRMILFITGEQDPRMPPEGSDAPSAEQIALVRAWIDAGAPGPNGQQPDPRELHTPRIEPQGPVRRPITAATFSPDGGLLAWAGPGRVRLIDSKHRGLVRKLEGHRGQVNDLAFSADGKLLAAAAGEPGLFGEVRLWDPSTGSLVRVVEGHQDAIYAVAISPDGALLATGSYDQRVMLWETATGLLVRTIEGHSGAIYDLAFRPDGKLLASASADRTVKLWEVASGERRDTLGQSLKELYTVAFSPDGSRVAAAGVDNRIRIWQVSPDGAEGTNPLLLSRVGHEAAILQLAYSPDGKSIATAAEDRQVRLWRSSDAGELRALPAQGDWPSALAFSPDSTLLAVGRLDGTGQLYLAATGQPAPPPTPELASLSPRGAQLGVTARVLVEGKALGDVVEIQTSNPALRAQAVPPDAAALDVESDSAGSQLWVQLESDDTLAPGTYEIALKTAGGTSNKLKLVLDDLPQAAEVEPNSTTAQAQPLRLPVGAWGALDPSGDVDVYSFEAQAGQTVVCEISAASLGSKADVVLTLFDSQGRLLSTNNDYEGQEDPLLAVTVPATGRYTLEVGDLVLGGSPNHFYRLSVGTFGYVTGVFPLGTPADTQSEIELAGYNLPEPARVAVATGKAAETTVPIDRRQFRLRRPFKLQVGGQASTAEVEPNDRPELATPVTLPALVEGRIWRVGNQQGQLPEEDVDLVRFDARKGETWIVETVAAERGSPLDSQLEVLDAQGQPVTRMNLVAVRDSAITFRPINSLTVDVRLTNWEEMELNQFVYFQGEVCRLFRLPQGPDSGFLLYGWKGQRVSYFDTSPTTHAVDEPCYIVEPRPVTEPVAATGLPVFPLTYVNDDDGQRKRGSDSSLTFTAPADGGYLVRVRDVRGLAGPQFAYRLAIRQPRPDFLVSVSPANPTVATGTARPITIVIDRRDGFDDEVSVAFSGAPEGFSFTGPVVVEAGQTEATAYLYAAPDAPQPADEAAKANRIVATAQIAGSPVSKPVTPLGQIRLANEAKLRVYLDPPEITVAPGQTVTARLRVERSGFEGLVNFSVPNLPHGVYVDNIGLNGVLIPESESEREIFFTARPWVPETTRAVAAVATNAGGVASAPVQFHVRQPQTVAQREN